MSWIAVDTDGSEYIYDSEPERGSVEFMNDGYFIELPKDSIEKLIGRKLTWKDEPVELK